MPPPGDAPATAVLAVCASEVIVSTVVGHIHCRSHRRMGLSFGSVLRQAREVRGLTSSETARGAGISSAYLNKLESDAVKRPSPVCSIGWARSLGFPTPSSWRSSGIGCRGSRVHPTRRVSVPHCSPTSRTMNERSSSSTSRGIERGRGRDAGTARAGRTTRVKPPRWDQGRPSEPRSDRHDGRRRCPEASRVTSQGWAARCCHEHGGDGAPRSPRRSCG